MTNKIRKKLREMIYSELFEALNENPLANPDGTLPSPRKKDDEDDERGVLLGDLEETDKSYGDALKQIARDKQLAMLSKKDKETLLKIAKLLKKEKEKK
jgi:hypothetical protein